jgi:hypothetical protein
MIHCPRCEGIVQISRRESGEWYGQCDSCSRSFGDAYLDYSSAISSTFTAIRCYWQRQEDAARRLEGMGI